ncbi:MAG: hypothetical protein KJO36_00650 [Acidimicrobiia bacterium]|nr:hypothetical protein [Acidimicrobiia bacterium]
MDDPVTTAPSVRVAHGFRQRLFGLGRKPLAGTSLAFRTRSVHTFLVGTTISVAALDERGRVLHSERLAPNRLYVQVRAAWIAEWAGAAPPPVDTVITLLK